MNNFTKLASTIAILHLGAAMLPSQWGPVVATTPPPPRSDALLAFELLNNRTLMIGGNSSDEFWSLSNGIWTQLNPAVRPSARRYANIATDLLTGRILLYGGQGAGQPTALDDTWLWDGNDWQQLTPAVSPGGIMWHGMAFDNARQVSVFFGGRRDTIMPNQVLDETWEFSYALNQWSQVFTPSPPALLRPAMCFHPTLNATILFGGELYGGTASDETWTFDGSNWTEINFTGVKPPARAGGQMVQILNRGIAVLSGGRDPVTFEILNDTWEHDGTSWREITNVYGGIYPARAEFGMTHDFVRDRIVAFGGKVANQGLRNDTWEYGSQWQLFGNGCAGSAGTPTFTGIDLPRIGTTATAEVGNVPPSIPFAFVAVGLSRTQWALGNLPMQLTAFGMPGCLTHTSVDLLVYVPATAGTATWSWQVPLDPNIIGEAFYLQGITFDPGANALGLAVSNAATMVIGN